MPAPAAIALRPYQRDCIDIIRDGWGTHQTQLAVLATGCGKTIIFSQIAREFAAAGKRVLILADTKELIEQAHDKLKKTTGINAGIEMGEMRASISEKVVVASVQTISGPKRLASWPAAQFSLIIVDEADKSVAKSYDRVFAHFQNAKILGVTATPDRGDKKSLGRRYANLAFNYDILQAVRDGWLIRPVVQTIPLQIDLRALSGKKIHSQSDLDNATAERLKPFLSTIAEEIVKNAGNRVTVIFTPTVETAQLLSGHINEKTASAASQWVCGDLTRCPDRASRVADFSRGRFQFLCNAQMLLRGFDYPAVSCVCILRPTKIRSLYCQAVGRGTRVLPGVIDSLADASAQTRLDAIAASQKKDLLLLDFLWLSEAIDLVKPAHLVSGDIEVVKRVRDGDLIANTEAAARDLNDSLIKAAKRNAHKKGARFDPFTKQILPNTLPEELQSPSVPPRENPEPVTPKQLNALIKAGIDPSKVETYAQAEIFLRQIDERKQRGICSISQQTFLEKFGYDNAAGITAKRAKQLVYLHISGKYKYNPACGEDHPYATIPNTRPPAPPPLCRLPSSSSRIPLGDLSDL